MSSYKEKKGIKGIKGILFAILVLFVGLIFALYMNSYDEDLELLPIESIPDNHPALEIDAIAQLALAAFTANFISPEGVIVSQLHQNDGEEAISLLESYGQLLEIALLINDEELLNDTWNITKRLFLSSEGYFYWRIQKDSLQPSMVTALIDEFRLLRALTAAAEQFNNPYYRDQALIVAESIRKHHLRNGRFVDHYEAITNNNSSILSLFYVDPVALNQMVTVYAELEEKVERTKQIAIKAKQNKNGFLPTSFDVEKRKYLTNKEYNMVEALYIAFVRQQLDLPIDSFLQFMRVQLTNNDAIYNYYDEKGKPLTIDESTAVYALAARLFYNNNDETYYRHCLVNMYKFLIIDNEHSFAGCFGDPVNDAVYAYDQLEAIKTLYRGVSQ